MSVIDLIQSIGIILGLIFTFFQMWANNKNLRVSIYSTISERNNELTRLFLDNPKIIKKLSKGYAKPNGHLVLTPETALCYQLLNFLDELHYYFHSKTIRKSTWKAYLISSRKLVAPFPYIRGFWEDVKNEYDEDLQKEINRLFD